MSKNKKVASSDNMEVKMPNDSEQRAENMDNYVQWLWKQRELVGNAGMGENVKFYTFPYITLKDLKTTPDKVKYHATQNPKGVLLVVQTPAGQLYYIMADNWIV